MMLEPILNEHILLSLLVYTLRFPIVIIDLNVLLLFILFLFIVLRLSTTSLSILTCVHIPCSSIIRIERKTNVHKSEGLNIFYTLVLTRLSRDVRRDLLIVLDDMCGVSLCIIGVSL